MRIPALSALLVCALLAPGCKGNSKSRAELALEELQKKKEAAKAAADTEAPAALPADVVQLDPPWDDGSNEKIIGDGPCPADFWALFSSTTPGETKADQKENNARRKDLAAALRNKQYLVKLRAPSQVTLKEYDAPKGSFPLDVIGSIDCTDDFGTVTIAWTAAKAVDPGASAAKEGAEVTQNVWQAPAMALQLPKMTMAEAKEFESKHKFAMQGRVVFKLGAVSIDKKLKKVAKVAENVGGVDLGFGGGVEDWGAGRMVRAELVGLRVATDREKTELLVQRGK